MKTSSVQTPKAKQPVLSELHRQFRSEPLKQDLLINSVPKAGTMLLRNVLFMFVPAEQIRWKFVNSGNIAQVEPGSGPYCYAGHVPFSPEGLKFLRSKRHVIIMRHPHKQILSYARFILSPHYLQNSQIGAFITENDLAFDDIVRLVITGFRVKNEVIHSVRDIYIQQALGWAGLAHIVRYEEMTSAINRLDRAYFEALLGAAGLEMTDDWENRVSLGSDPSLSSTSSEGFSFDSRKSLTEDEVRLFNIVAPGLCELLGYDELPS